MHEEGRVSGLFRVPDRCAQPVVIYCLLYYLDLVLAGMRNGKKKGSSSEGDCTYRWS